MVRTPGGHAPNIKNRSSKNLICLTGVKSAYRSLSGAALTEMSKRGDTLATKEINRRSKKNEKKNNK